ncbi:MAG: DUF4129 domain-containing protein [Deltaproteobacteria bacterium]|nr:DUF4129 domain-containing protein [Deltaproteobacteria bacterium]
MGSDRGVRRLAALILLVVCFVAPALAKKPDVKDTQERLSRIYKELGIERRAETPPPPKGCDGEGEGAGPRPGVGAPGLPAGLGYVLIAVIIAAMLVPLILALRGSFREEPRPEEVPPEEEADEAAAPARRGPWSVDLSDCRRLVAEGRVAEACAALHRLCLLSLERAGHLALEPSITNWEYVRRLKDAPSLGQLLAELTRVAEAAVLGRRTPERADYDRLEALVVAQARVGA